ncbi:hypothetical protein L6452_19675 [Arctium lappa]|uniref:Uncharacterized protein n=1 Tax=Arctium lappa TaxID=4217 RepID=A0ACB9B987_ARCLA|nr:hypothetical protein L6452_19675 [Arctium lappa]
MIGVSSAPDYTPPWSSLLQTYHHRFSPSSSVPLFFGPSSHTFSNLEKVLGRQVMRVKALGIALKNADKSPIYAHHAYMIPLGVAPMVVDIDDENGPLLFKCDPADQFFGHKGDGKLYIFLELVMKSSLAKLSEVLTTGFPSVVLHQADFQWFELTA